MQLYDNTMNWLWAVPTGSTYRQIQPRPQTHTYIHTHRLLRYYFIPTVQGDNDIHKCTVSDCSWL